MEDEYLMYNDLVEKVRDAGQTVEFFGPQDDAKVDLLAAALETELPPSFRKFLRAYGGGGILGEWISGIYDGAPLLRNEGSVYGDTMRCRERHALPKHLVVVYTQDEEVIWCIDTLIHGREGEYPVVSFDPKDGSTTLIAASFGEFFRDYLRIHAEIG